MNHIDEATLAQLTTQLQAEKADLEKVLAGEGRIIDGDKDWAAVPPAPDTSEEDPTVQADRFAEFFNRGGSVAELEVRLNNVLAALERIEAGTYGLSEASGEPIELERLVANPAATTTIAEMQATPAETPEKLS